MKKLQAKLKVFKFKDGNKAFHFTALEKNSSRERVFTA